MRALRENGSILLTLVIAMTMMAVLGAGLYKLTATSSFGEVLAGNNDNAYELAKSGLRYAIGLHAPNLSATTFNMPDADHTFTISISNGIITSTGVVNSGSFTEARRVLTFDASWAPLPSNIISFADDMPSFGSPIISNAAAPPDQRAIQANTANNSIDMGGGVTDAYGTLLYQGSSVVGYCTNGQCSLGQGINVYFEFTFPREDYSSGSTNSADGFTFAVLSALTNTRDRSGGAGGGVSQGELMGYAGPDNTADQLGLRPPKMAIEFDTYPNTGSGDVCSAGTRYDASPFSNHAALMFWGTRTISGACGGYNKSSYDDNRHGAGGTGGDPQNSVRGDGGYYEGDNKTCKSSANRCNWMEDGYTYNVRVEVIRPGAPSGGLYPYRVKTWVLSQNPACTSACYYALNTIQKSRFRDVMVSFADMSPQIDRTVNLNQQDHDDMSKIFFGFTEATGASTQRIILTGLRAFFPQGSCSYSISPDNASFPMAGGAGSVTVSTQSNCPWMSDNTTMSDNTSSIFITSGGSGMGNGTINYSVAANTGGPRTGYINVAGYTHTITQGSGCSYALSPGSATPGSGSGSGSFSVTAGTGCAWTASSDSPGWLTTSSSGAGNGTVNYSYTANTGPARTGIITVGGQTFTVTQASGCSYAISPSSVTPGSGLGSGSFSVTTGAGCTWTASSDATSWLTTSSSGTGSGTVNYSYTANAGPARTGHIAVGSQTFTVTQASGCSYGISPAGQAFGVSGGTGYISVTTSDAACPWSATESLTWVSITSGSSGTGNGTVVYSVSANSGAARNGTITVAGQGFAVSQAAAPCAPISITTTSLPNGVEDNSYTAVTMNSSGGTLPLSWSASGLPAGLSINASTGAISGTVNTSGSTLTSNPTYSPTITVIDSCSAPQTASQSYSIIIYSHVSYDVRNNTGGTFRVRGGQYSSCTAISNGSDFVVNYSDASAVGIFTNSSCSIVATLPSVSYSSAAAADAGGNDTDNNAQVNSSWQLLDR